MRVCLVIPPSPYLLSDRSLPWLGPLWVAACLREGGHSVRVLDLAGEPDYVDVAKNDAALRGADVYGLTATAPDYPLAVEIRDAIRSVRPKQRVILGGAHATLANNLDVDVGPGWDAIVRGDGWYASERALTEDGIISARLRGEIVEDVDSLPFPARDLIDLESYHFDVVGERATILMSSFSCSMGCTFCSGRNVFSYRKPRTLSPNRVLRELDHIRANWPVFRALTWMDDEINIPPQRAIELCEAIAQHPTKFLHRAFVKAELFSPEVARAMASAGFVEVLTGVESGSDRILKRIRKNTTYAINMQARRTAKEYGIRMKASTMIGLPGETIQDVMLTKQWLLEARPEAFDVCIYQPMPGSPIYDDPEKYGVGLFYEKDGKILPYKTFSGGYRAKTRTETLSSDDLVRLRDEIDRDVRQALGLRMPTRSAIDASMGQRPVLSSL